MHLSLAYLYPYKSNYVSKKIFLQVSGSFFLFNNISFKGYLTNLLNHRIKLIILNVNYYLILNNRKTVTKLIV